MTQCYDKTRALSLHLQWLHCYHIKRMELETGRLLIDPATWIPLYHSLLASCLLQFYSSRRENQCNLWHSGLEILSGKCREKKISPITNCQTPLNCPRRRQLVWTELIPALENIHITTKTSYRFQAFSWHLEMTGKKISTKWSVMLTKHDSILPFNQENLLGLDVMSPPLQSPIRKNSLRQQNSLTKWLYSKHCFYDRAFSNTRKTDLFYMNPGNKLGLWKYNYS